MEGGVIDLRSDVVTRAPPAMLEIMSQADVKNNQSLDDIGAISFENRLADMFGKEAALFFPTASMANIAAVIAQTRPGSQIIISSSCHSVERESSSFALLAGVQTRQIFTQTGTFTVDQVKERIRKEANHVTFPNTDVIFVENGTFRGRVWDLTQLRAIKKLAEENNVKVHIDGARIFNALATYKFEGKELSDTFDSMTICLTKGLCCPIGAAVIGSKQLIKELKNIRKGLGGGLWHPGILTAAGNYALDHLLPEIKLDNQMALLLATELSAIKGIEVDPSSVQINMVYWTVSTPNFNHQQFHDFLSSNHIRSKAYDEDTCDYRFVTHSGVRRVEVDKVVTSIKHYFESL